MISFFRIFTLTPWDTLNSDILTEVKLFSLKNIFKKYPVIEPEFFDDILSNLYKFKHYSWVESIKRIIGPNAEDYDIEPWNFVWGMDNERRIYQFLIQKSKEKAILVALAPPELGKLFKQYKKEAIIRTLSLLNNPEKMKFLMVLAPKGKSIAEERQLLQINRKELEKLKFNNMLKQMPNIKGQWFPTFEAKCPICNGMLTEIKDYGVGFGKLVCPKCGYNKIK
ncbi:MAG: hypothetical protein JSV23_10550 [Promethearchaeota archaeon]|nr:MAG: hypothetical protein JSV23_10550 [Candidatus Lokiarchaeota archaeon]